MAAANSTTEGNQKRITEMYCSAEFIGEVDSELIFLSVLNSLLSITAFLGNALILVALHKESSLHPPSKLLYRNLAIADLCVGIIVQPVDVANWMSAVNEGWTICYYTELTAFIISHILCSVSLLTSTAISAFADVEIQASCNFAKNIFNCHRCLGFLYRRNIKLLFESSGVALVYLHGYICVSSYLKFVLHENFLHFTS